MTDDPLFRKFREQNWRKKLDPEEEAALKQWLASHPEAAEQWESEAQLTEALGRLPDCPVASNFTARILDAVERESKRDRISAITSRKPFWLRWLPRTAVAAMAISAGLLGYHEVQVSRHRQQLTSLRLVSEVASLPDPQSLLDFDAIQAMSQTPTPSIRAMDKARPAVPETAADTELLSLLQ